MLGLVLAAGVSVTVAIDPVHALRGTMVVELCGAADYRDNSCTREARVAVEASPFRVTFLDVPPGRWAVRVLQDFNGNGVMDHRFGLFPREPFGFSRLKRFPTSEPKFEAIAVEVPAAPTTIPVTLLNQPKR
jgi:uncharacterized protein (DUF2141 family)